MATLQAVRAIRMLFLLLLFRAQIIFAKIILKVIVRGVQKKQQKKTVRHYAQVLMVSTSQAGCSQLGQDLESEELTRVSLSLLRRFLIQDFCRL